MKTRILGLQLALKRPEEKLSQDVECDRDENATYTTRNPTNIPRPVNPGDVAYIN